MGYKEIAPGALKYLFFGSGVFKNMKLSDTDRRIINLIGDHSGSCPQAAIITALMPDVNTTYAYMRIKRLEAGGLLDKSGPDNGRTVTLTIAGKAALRE